MSRDIDYLEVSADALPVEDSLAAPDGVARELGTPTVGIAVAAKFGDDWCGHELTMRGSRQARIGDIADPQAARRCA
jgi:hypothetical protein